jgi:hypothetical protein
MSDLKIICLFSCSKFSKTSNQIFTLKPQRMGLPPRRDFRRQGLTSPRILTSPRMAPVEDGAPPPPRMALEDALHELSQIKNGATVGDGAPPPPWMWRDIEDAIRSFYQTKDEAQPPPSMAPERTMTPERDATPIPAWMTPEVAVLPPVWMTSPRVAHLTPEVAALPPVWMTSPRVAHLTPEVAVLPPVWMTSPRVAHLTPEVAALPPTWMTGDGVRVPPQPWMTPNEVKAGQILVTPSPRMRCRASFCR